VMASVAAIGGASPTVIPVRYAVVIDADRPGHDRPATRARAPLRPPSTAPPAFLNA
jgi:hypothetical protein